MTERAGQIELGKLLAMARAGRQPGSDVAVAQLLGQYVATPGWDVSTRVGTPRKKSVLAGAKDQGTVMATLPRA